MSWFSETHVPVMVEEVISLLVPRSGEAGVDCTVGAGGHAAAILERTGPEGPLLGLDRNPGALEVAREKLSRFSGRAWFLRRPFAEVRAAMDEVWGAEVNADLLLADLGLNSMMLRPGGGGFSFQHDEILDMRMDPASGETAAELLARLPERELADVLFRLGGERGSRRIARAVKNAPPLATTGELCALIERTLGPRRRGGIHPATRTFQALRMAVNDEVGQLESLLAVLPRVMASGGRVAFLCYHSGEDRLVKLTFKSLSAAGRCIILTAKPLRPSTEERARNPRSRSARLRAVRWV